MRLKVVVSGVGIAVVAARHRTIRALVKDALLASGNIGGALTEWELRTVDGRLLEPGVKLRDAGVSHGDALFLSPRAGVGAAVSFNESREAPATVGCFSRSRGER